MNDWFSINGRRCTDMGIHVSEQPPITIPEQRALFTDVPGRSGSLTMLEGEDVYNDLVLPATCFITDTGRINEICAFLKESGRVAFANRQGGFYYGRVVNQIPFEQILRGRPHKTFTVNFRCKPFWYAENPEPVTITESTGTITNPGNVHSEPIITVYGSGEITLMVGMTIVELSDIEDKAVGFGMAAGDDETVSFGWPVKLKAPLEVSQGGTGGNSQATACAALGAVKKTGDTMTGNLSIQSSLYPSVYLLPTYNSTTNRTVFEGSYAGASSFASWEDSSGNNRRMLEVRTAQYAASMDNAVLLRTCANGTWGQYQPTRPSSMRWRHTFRQETPLWLSTMGKHHPAAAILRTTPESRLSP